MKVELISVGTPLLLGEVVHVNLAYVVKSVRQLGLELVCHVTVAEVLTAVQQCLETALARADVVLTMGGMADGLVCQAAEGVRQQRHGRPLALVDVEACRMFEMAEGKLLFCLPDERRLLSYLLETAVLPYLHQQLQPRGPYDWLLLRTAGVMESSLRKQLDALPLQPGQSLSYDTFAGQTDLRLMATAAQPAAVAPLLNQLKQVVLAHIGDHVFGERDDLLEEVVVGQMVANKLSLTAAECYTDQILLERLRLANPPAGVLHLLPTQTEYELVRYLSLYLAALDDDLSGWCAQVAGELRRFGNTDLGLLIHKNETAGGVQLLVTLASPYGTVPMLRSFGGHPKNVDQWASTLGLVHLWRWLQMYPLAVNGEE